MFSTVYKKDRKLEATESKSSNPELYRVVMQLYAVNYLPSKIAGNFAGILIPEFRFIMVYPCKFPQIIPL